MYEFEVENNYGDFDSKTGASTGMVMRLREDVRYYMLCLACYIFLLYRYYI